ncbi:synaptonemal complex protein 2 [Embiotoca jacksoni]|uniref:synaptonemal complex protein 2 n=1 Tax=Embiotoca jacksoni TaxID=100190 RepID=UPI0037044BB2
MASGQSAQHGQLENVIDEVLKSRDVRALDVFLQRDIREETPMKCSQQFLTKLDKVIGRSLDKKDPKSASLGLVSLYKCGKCLKLPGGGQGLAGLMAQGLIKKMVQWFEKCRQLWIQCGLQWDETLFTLAEDFLNALMAIHEACKEGTYKITESFLYPVGQLAVDPRIYTLIQKEAIRKFNLILDKVPVELKKDKKLLTSQDASDIMIKLAGQIMEGGDYDLQSSLMEALCRMATPDQRKKQADRWFSMGHVATAFAKIRDSEFETACRSFLNMVNGMQGDRRRVYSYPCLEVYLDKYELLMPTDEKLEEFWIDFNLSSRSISFYFSLVDEEAQEGHWETISINENEVQSYTVTEEGKRKILQIKMSEVVVVGAVEGSCLTIRFSSSLDILQAARNIYGHNKSKGTSVVKTTAKTVVAENCTQVVPESQVSPGEGERSTAPYHLPAPAAPVQMVTPAKKRISESTTFISSSSGGVVHRSRSLAVMQSRTPATAKDKASLEMVRSCDATVKACSDSTTLGSTKAAGMKEQSAAAKQVIKKKVDKHKKDIPVAEAVHMVLSGEEKKSQDHNFVPDTQPSSGGNTSSCWSKFSVSEMVVMPTQKISSLPRPAPHSSIAGQQESRQSSAKKWSVSDSSICQKQLHIELTERLQQVLSERNQDPAPQEPAASQREMSDIRRGSKDRSTGDQSVLSLCTPNVQQALRHAKGKRKGQTLMEENAVPVKASGKISTTKSHQEMKPPNVKVETKRTLSHKEKRDAEVTGSMVKLISSHYEMSTCSTEKRNAENTPRNWIPPLVNRPVFNMSWQSTGKRQISGAVCQIEAHIKTTTKSVRKRGDIFSFNIDAPMSIGGSNKTFTNTSAILSSGIDSSSVLISTTKTDQPAAKNKRYVKKHLFSDTDTDNAMTEVSWLRESNRKAKPKIYEYSRQAPVQPKAVPPHTSDESPDFFPLSAKAVMANDKPSKKKPYLKKAVGQPKKAAAAPSRPHAAGKRPKRAAAISAKSYRVPDTDDSQSEPEKLPTPKYTVTDHLENTEEKMKQKKTFSKQTTKSSKKLESESVSEKPRTSKGKSEKPFLEVPKVKRKNTFAEQSTDNYRTRDSNIQSDKKTPSGLKQKRPENVLQDTSTLNKKSVTTAQVQMSALKDSWAACQTSFCPSPPFIETMRSAERSAPTLSSTLSPLLTPRGSPLPASPDPPCQDTPLPILLLPKPRSAVSSKGNCKPSTSYSAEKKRISSKTRSIRSVPSLPLLRGQTPPLSPLNGPSAAEQHLSSAKSASSLSTRPLLTSTFLELDKPPVPSPQSPFPEDTINHSRHSVSSKVSSVSRVSLSQSSTKSSVLSRRVKDSRSASLAGSCTIEKSPLPDRDLTLEQRHVSGPRRKRHISLSSNSEEDEKEERKKSKMRRQRSPRMKPRKLFKSFAEASALEELSQVMSSSRMSSSHWEAEVVDGDMDRDEDLELREMTVNPNNLGQHMSSELHKKFQNRSKIIEVYNKQSLKTMQQHVSSINVQVTKNRTEMIEKVKEVLLEEIHKLEQGDTVLKSMEKDFTIHWKKQTIAFHSYQKQETRRNETLKRALQSNMCHSVEFEKRIFTSQMGLIRKDMKSVQDRLLSEMQEGEIQSVKRGLHALFFP